MKYFGVSFCLYALVAMALAGVFAGDGLLLPGNALERYDLYVSNVNTTSFTSITTWREIGKDDAHSFLKKAKIDFRGRKIYQGDSVTENEMSSYEESIFYPGYYVYVSSFTNAAGKEIGIIGYKDVCAELWEKTLGLHSLTLPFGYLSDGQRIISISELIVNSNNYEVNSLDDNCIEISGSSQGFTFLVSLDVQKGYVPRKIFFKRVGLPKGIENYVSIDYFVDHFIEKNGVWFPRNFTCVTEYPGGTLPAVLPVGANVDSPEMEKMISETTTRIPKRTIEEKVEFSNVEFPSSFAEKDFKLHTSIPNGTPAYMQDALHIEHIWYDGKIVPKTNEVMLAIARGNHKFMPGPNEPRFWLMAIGIILIVVALGKMLYDIIQKNNQEKREGGQ